MQQLDLLDALKARDVAIDLVSANADGWMAVGLALLGTFPIGQEGTGEDFRLRLRDKGLPNPHHHNAWGALILSAQRRQLLLKTGEMRHMRQKKSHARLTPVYRRIQEAAA